MHHLHVGLPWGFLQFPHQDAW